jgi:hypothetical protein
MLFVRLAGSWDAVLEIWKCILSFFPLISFAVVSAVTRARTPTPVGVRARV